MSEINLIAISGRLTRDPELRHTPGGTPVMNARLAYSYGRKTGDRWEDVSQFVDVDVFGKRAEFYSSKLTKGSMVFVSGVLRWSGWEAQDGSKRQKNSILANEIKSPDLFGPRSTAERDDDVETAPGPPKSSAPSAPIDDDIPF